MFGFNFNPKGTAMCNGQLLPINQNQALFSLLGTTFGGNGTTTFALPELRGRVPIHPGTGFTLGQSGGEENHTLVVSEIPSHTHPVSGSSGAGTSGDPTGNLWADGGKAGYSTGAPNQAMAANTLANTGSSQPHSNMAPYLTINFCIALTGIFPTRS